MTKRPIYIGADSAGYLLKETLKKQLEKDGYEVTDVGCHSTDSCHYPEFASAVSEAVSQAPDTTFGILVCGTGIGMSMCANKFRGVRAAVCTNAYTGAMTRAHNDANVLCIGARVTNEATAFDILEAFLSTPFEGGRHKTRVDMISAIEEANM
jgi:ribose 5-phosphate isomerase B